MTKLEELEAFVEAFNTRYKEENEESIYLKWIDYDELTGKAGLELMIDEKANKRIVTSTKEDSPSKENLAASMLDYLPYYGICLAKVVARNRAMN